MKTKLPNLPPNDDDYWDGADVQRNTPVKMGLCESHFKKWEKHNGYIDNHDGTISCKFCAWGTRLPGHMRVYMGKVVDFRKL
jgi:hypothetical protein